MMRRMLAVVLVLAVAMPALADKFDAKKLKGSWTRELCGTQITFEFKDEKKLLSKVTPSGADQGITVEIDYTIDDKGVLSGTIAKVEPAGAEGPGKGEKFSFKLETSNDTLTISNFDGIEGEEVRRLVEGEYKRPVN